MNYNFIWLLCYLLVLVGLAGYGFHRLTIVYLYWKNRNNKPQPKSRFRELPVVTVQLPMFNEKFVVDRLLESVAALDYPKDKLEIQILDDSTDDTTEQCYRKVEELKSRGFDAVCIHRTDRTGFKAGALEAATKVAKGEFLLILDADFVPEPDLLQKTIHYFTDEGVGLVPDPLGPYQPGIQPAYPHPGHVPGRPLRHGTDGPQPFRTLFHVQRHCRHLAQMRDRRRRAAGPTIR